MKIINLGGLLLFAFLYGKVFLELNMRVTSFGLIQIWWNSKFQSSTGQISREELEIQVKVPGYAKANDCEEQTHPVHGGVGETSSQEE